jgi:hypothetical protein
MNFSRQIDRFLFGRHKNLYCILSFFINISTLFELRKSREGSISGTKKESKSNDIYIYCVLVIMFYFSVLETTVFTLIFFCVYCDCIFVYFIPDYSVP